MLDKWVNWENFCHSKPALNRGRGLTSTVVNGGEVWNEILEKRVSLICLHHDNNRQVVRSLISCKS